MGQPSCAPKNDEWNDLLRRSFGPRRTRQGVPYHVLDDLMIADPATMQPGPKRRRDHGRGDDARQYRHERLSEKPTPLRKPFPMDGSTQVTSGFGIRTAISPSKTARRTSLSPAARTYRPSKSKKRFTTSGDPGSRRCRQTGRSLGRNALRLRCPKRR